MNSKKYAKTISKYMNYFSGKFLYLPVSNVGIQTGEGVEAFKNLKIPLIKMIMIISGNKT